MRPHLVGPRGQLLQELLQVLPVLDLPQGGDRAQVGRGGQWGVQQGERAYVCAALFARPSALRRVAGMQSARAPTSAARGALGRQLWPAPLSSTYSGKGPEQGGSHQVEPIVQHLGSRSHLDAVQCQLSRWTAGAAPLTGKGGE